MKPIVIACGTDEYYALGCAVMVRSALDTLSPGRRVELYVLHGDIRPDTRATMIASWKDPRLTVEFIHAQPMLPTGLFTDGKTDATYYRLLLPKLLPQHDRALYLDSDTVVLADIAELWEMDLQGKAAMVLPDLVVPAFNTPNWGIKNWQTLGFSGNEPYFNAGVMLMDLKAWRREDIGGRVLEFTLSQAGDVYLWDQDGLNAVLSGNWTPLPTEWNCMSEGLVTIGTWSPPPERRAELTEVEQNAKILHFAGAKPWYPGCTHPRRNLFYAAMDRTAWKGFRPDAQKPAAV